MRPMYAASRIRVERVSGLRLARMLWLKSGQFVEMSYAVFLVGRGDVHVWVMWGYALCVQGLAAAVW